MPTVQQTSTFNVIATINKSLETAVSGFSLPAWLPTRPTVAFDWNDAALTAPSFATIDIPVIDSNEYQGMHVGSGKRGYKSLNIFEVSCWVSQNNITENTPNVSWQAQLRTMSDWVSTWAGDTKQLIILDYAANQSTPSNTEYLITFGDVAPLVHQPDSVNPALIRKRILIDYWYIKRVT